MSNLTVIVKNVSPLTSDGEVKDFFSFCGKITDIKVTTEGETKTAHVTFEKETATKTALLLNNTQLGTTHITVTGTQPASELDGSHVKSGDSDEITQEMKPRSRILAEYLAHGYVVGDATIQQAIELDKKHEVSNRFLNTIQELDKKYHATDRAKATDQSLGLSQRANSIFGGLSSYFVQARDTPTGRKIANFYLESSKEVQDIHNEARRLADMKKQEHGGSAYKAAGFERFFGKEKPAGQADAPPAQQAETEEKKSE